MKTLHEHDSIDLNEKLEIAIDVIRRYVTTLGTLAVEHDGILTIDTKHTRLIEGKRVDFELEQLDGGKINLYLLLDGVRMFKEKVD